MTAKEHYDNHLANFYEWMAGDFETKQKEQQDFFERNGIKPLQNKIAIDLGSGHGLQSIALARLDFKVTAVDFSRLLLENLFIRGKEFGIQVLERDLLSEENFKKQAEIIVCMGDTIAHLESVDQIRLLLERCFNCLLNNGKLVLSFRDYGTELVDTQRFIPVKSNSNKILTCFLEYSPDKVKVTDLLHEQSNGQWIQKVSSYFKIRITNRMIEKLVLDAGFKIMKSDVINRMNYLIAGK
jgi:2-polyprenyl-3-methyl-5-hydroxy-6-metoxy-1,4-benzoquinol methylase